MNLVRFEHSSYFLVKHSFLGVGVPKLEEAYFTVGPDGDVQDIFHLAKDLPNLRVLYVLDNGDSVCIPKSIAIFSKVEMLELNFPLEIKFDFLEMIAILRAFPLLQKFYLAVSDVLF
uniref:FBD domain-containing protein n=1 Tax=Fagus sylvatica TaxID=28930 RepID=A0A2N9FTV5_FAGSY